MFFLLPISLDLSLNILIRSLKNIQTKSFCSEIIFTKNYIYCVSISNCNLICRKHIITLKMKMKCRKHILLFFTFQVIMVALPNLFFKLVLRSRSNNWDVITRKGKKEEKEKYRRKERWKE